MTTILAPTTRPATDADGDFLRALFVSSRPFDATALAAVPGLLEMQYVARQRSHAAAHASLRDQIVLVGDVPVGRLLTARTAAGQHVVDVALVPLHRGRGLGTVLLAGLLGDGPVTLEVATTNPARRLYERLGFTTVSTTDTDLSLQHPGNDTFEGAGA
jgi:ribosomal protein S18 acetylase RimI-like enzyme